MPMLTRRRLKVAWKIIRAALGVLTVAVPGSREALVASTLLGMVKKNAKKTDKLVVRYEQALIAQARVNQLVSIYEKQLDESAELESKLNVAAGVEVSYDDASKEV